MSIITLTTDFGIGDAYTGVMKGVILGINPDVRMIDLSHQVAPQAVRQAAYILWTAVPYFPAGTVHLAVVDPGVGTTRRSIAIQTASAFFVGPDNGLFSLVLGPRLSADPGVGRRGDAETERSSSLVLSHSVHPFSIVRLENSRYWRPEISQTFHGRDIFAPVAAHLSRGVALEDLGERVHDPVVLPVLQPQRESDGSIAGHVLHVDHFGNVVTDVPGELISGSAGGPGGAKGSGAMANTPRATAEIRIPGLVVEIAGRRFAGLKPAYGSVERGELLAVLGSQGLLEIAVREGNAAQAMGAKVGDAVVVQFEG